MTITYYMPFTFIAICHFHHNGENRWQNGYNFRHYGKIFRHYGKNGEKMFAIFAIMVKIGGKMAKINGEIFSRHFRHFAMAKIDEKIINGEWQ